MARKVDTRIGLTGYLHQLQRTRRFLKRFETQPRTFSEFEEELHDFALAFFQNCHHMTDWMKHDPAATPDQKGSGRCRGSAVEGTEDLPGRGLCGQVPQARSAEVRERRFGRAPHRQHLRKRRW